MHTVFFVWGLVVSHKVRGQCVFVCAAIEQYINSPCCWIYRRIAAVCVSTMLYNLHTYVMLWSCRVALLSHTHTHADISLSLFTRPSHAQACGLCTHTHPHPHTHTHWQDLKHVLVCLCLVLYTLPSTDSRPLCVCFDLQTKMLT